MSLSRAALAIAIVTCIAVVAAAAAPQPTASSTGKKLYHWVSADGKDHYSDDLPPEALNQAREELSKSGIALKHVERALTTEERSAAQEKAAADAKAVAIADKSKQSDQVLLASYPNEMELKRAYDDRIEQQAEAVKTIRIELQGQQQSLSSLLIVASNLELSDKPVGKDLGLKIQTAHSHVFEDQKTQVQQMAQLAKLNEESAGQIAHYRALRAAEDAKNVAEPGEPPAATPPPKG